MFLGLSKTRICVCGPEKGLPQETTVQEAATKFHESKVDQVTLSSTKEKSISAFGQAKAIHM